MKIINSVGKTSLMKRFVLNKFIGHYKTTIGSDFLSKDVIIDDKTISLQVFRTISHSRSGIQQDKNDIKA